MSLRLTDLHKTFADGTRAVKGVDLSCDDGDFVVLLGPSGCGKTTTLRMIAGLETPTRGSITVGGVDVTSLPVQARNVGFVFQFYALYPHMKVVDNVGFPLECSGISRGRKKEMVDAVVTRLGLESLAGRYPGQLSGGDQQRVALARAMVRRPAIYLMDEPLGTLDADLRLEMRELIKSQQLDMGVTTIYVTHDQEEAMNLADRVVVMQEGLIRQIGEPNEVYDSPGDLFVAHFIGSSGMNFIEGEIVAGPEGGHFTAGELMVPVVAPRTGVATLGIRPEFVLPAQTEALHGRVLRDEYLGDFRNVHVKTDLGIVVMRDEGVHRHAPGDLIGLRFDPEHVRLFDSDTGQRLGTG